MLAAIEGTLEELFDAIETLPTDKVEAAEKVGQSTTHIVFVSDSRAHNNYYVERHSSRQ